MSVMVDPHVVMQISRLDVDSIDFLMHSAISEARNHVECVIFSGFLSPHNIAPLNAIIVTHERLLSTHCTRHNRRNRSHQGNCRKHRSFHTLFLIDISCAPIGHTLLVPSLPSRWPIHHSLLGLERRTRMQIRMLSPALPGRESRSSHPFLAYEPSSEPPQIYQI